MVVGCNLVAEVGGVRANLGDWEGEERSGGADVEVDGLVGGGHRLL